VVNPQTSAEGRKPLLWAALAFAGGIGTGVHARRPPLPSRHCSGNAGQHAGRASNGALDAGCSRGHGVGYISHALARIPVLIAGFALGGIAGTVRWLGGLRVADLRVPTPGTIVILLSAASIVLAMILIRRRPWVAVGGLVALAASAFWTSAVHPRPDIPAGRLGDDRD
jgi:hypothetical protein